MEYGLLKIQKILVKILGFFKNNWNKGEEIINYNKIFNKTRFFQNSKINYAENILRKKTNEIAIGFLSECGYKRKNNMEPIILRSL